MEARNNRLPNTPIIAIVDDDDAMREALSDLLQVLSLSCRTFASAEAFLGEYAPARFGCLITDLRMPGISGLELQRKLTAMGARLPVIVVTSCTDSHARTHAMENGAFAFLIKPVRDQDLIRHVKAALGQSISDE
tara:strand:- start:30 stop:434 length:405 start_codon:yes stop_codon:yes gene_type:complete